MPIRSLIAKVDRRTIKWLFVLIAGVTITAYLGHLIIKENSRVMPALAGVGAVVFIILGLGRPRPAQKLYKKFIPWVSLPILLLAIWAGCIRMFGWFDVEAVLFHINNPIKYRGIIADVTEFSIVIFMALGLIACIRYLGRRDSRMLWLDRLVAIPLFLVNPVAEYTYEKTLRPPLDEQLVDQFHEIDSIIQTLPGGKEPNLVLIYLESVEMNFSLFEGVFDELSDIQNQGLTVKGMHQVQDTGWTIAGIVSSQCGIPLMSHGIIGRNRFKNIDTMVPGVTCLGDVLKESGYETVYVGGAGLEFAGKGRFLRMHGYDRQYGENDFSPDLRPSFMEWGIPDEYVFARSLEEMRKLQANGKPYLLSMLTLSGHTPDGYPSPLCYDLIPSAKDMARILLSIKCAGVLTQGFLATAEEEGLLENTFVVVMNDHLAMKNSKYDELKKLDRQNYLTILGPDIPASVIERNGATFDVYPTLLSLLGFSLKDGRAGLGVDLLSDQQTLYEQFGADKLNRMIRYDNQLRRHIWNIDRLQ